MSSRPRTPTQQVQTSPWAWFAAGAGIGVLTVALHLWPAQWLAPVVRHISEGRIHLIEAQGTVWNGSAYLALGSGIDSTGTTAWAQRLHWRLGLQGLTALELRLRTEPQPQAPDWSWRLQWQPSGWALQVSDVEWRMPTAWLAGLGAPWNTVQPDGVMRLRSQNWQWQSGQRTDKASGQITLTLERFATRLSSLRPLGDYELKLQGGAKPQVELSTVQGHLRMTGQGHWQDGRLQFQGEAWADQAQDEIALSNLLSVLGQRVGSRTSLKVG